MRIIVVTAINARRICKVTRMRIGPRLRIVTVRRSRGVREEKG